MSTIELSQSGSLPRQAGTGAAGRRLAGTHLRRGTAAGPLQVELACGPENIAASLTQLPDEADTPFQSRPWLEAWAAALERNQGMLIVLRGTDSSHPLCLPLNQRRLGPVSLLESAMPRAGPVGSCAIPQWHEPSLAAKMWREVRAKLRIAGLGADALVLHDVPEWQARRVPGPCHLGERHASHSLSLATDWQAIYSNAFSKKIRSEVARRQRKLERELGTVRFDVLATQHQQQLAVRRMIAWKHNCLTAKRQRSGLACSHVRRFVEALPAAFAPSPEYSLIIVRLSAGGRDLAYNMGLQHGSTFYGLVMAHDKEAAARYGVGNILRNSLMDHLSRDGVRRIDMGKGNQDFKLALADAASHTRDVLMPLTAAGHAFAAGRKLVTPLRRRLRDNPLARRAYFAATRS